MRPLLLGEFKVDGTAPEINIQDLHKPAPEVVLKKSKKRKATGEGSSQKTPKAAKKKRNPSSVSVVESIAIPTSETIPLNQQKIYHPKHLRILT